MDIAVLELEKLQFLREILFRVINKITIVEDFYQIMHLWFNIIFIYVILS
jgi:hypothetical protein